MSEQLSELEQKMQQQVLRYEYVLEALSDIGDELCRVTSFDAQLKSLLHLLLGTLGVRKGGIFLFDHYNKKATLRCAWKLAHKTGEYNLSDEEFSQVEENTEEITFRISEYPYLQDIIQNFADDNLDCVSILRVREKLIGFLVVGHKLKNVALNDKEISFLKTLSRNISVAINNFLLLSELRESNVRLDEKIQEVSILYQASQMIASEIQLQALLDMAMSAISEITEIERGSTWLYEEEHKCFKLMSHLGDATELPDVFQLDDSKVFLHAFEKRDSFSYEKGEDEAFALDRSDEKLFGNAFIIVPIIHQGDFLGVVHLCGVPDGNGFTSRDIRLIKVFALQLGAAVKNAQLYEQAITDGMTKLYLHKYFKQRLGDEIKRAARFKRKLALIMVDIDHFKSFNDNFGHQSGDEVLKHVAAILRRAVRTHDLPVRYGGEEFALVLPETDMIGAVAVAERVRKSIDTEHLEVFGVVHKLAASFGVSVFPDCASDMDSLIKAADVALYWSKEHGRNQVTAAPTKLARATDG
jgi:diguanylate cyclase (GGDEF)-like protein